MSTEEMIRRMSFLGDVVLDIDRFERFYVTIPYAEIKRGNMLEGLYAPAETIEKAVTLAFYTLSHAQKVVVHAMNANKRKEYVFKDGAFVLV